MEEKQERKNEHVRRANRIIQERTIWLLVIFGVLIFVVLFFQLYHWQIKRHDEMQKLAVNQQTMRATVTASRGTIYDRNGYTLAVSSTAEDICLSPKELNDGNDKEKNAALASFLAKTLEMDEDKILKRMNKTKSQYEVIKKRADEELANRVREYVNEKKIKGVFFQPTSKRYYPYGSLAAHAIGFTNEAGGAYGLEAVYNEDLSGQNGMVVSAKNGGGGSLLFQYEQYFDARDGYSLHTTIDKTVQYYLEQGLEELESRFGTGKGAAGVVMSVKTGGILALASLPNYDLNDPSTIYNDFMKRQSAETVNEDGSTTPAIVPASDALLKQWRNKTINDTYEPGSTFKILTLSMGLEEGVIDLNSTFDCSGNIHISDAVINCSNRTGHGRQTLKQATGNSCNPAFINIGLRVGNEKFYQYMKDFGLTQLTNLDTTGETSGFVNAEIKNSTLALACYAFGQNFNVTPVSLITAQAACINGGYLRTPYLVDEIRDSNGNVVSKHDTTPIRQVISEKTSETVREILEYVVAEGTGKNGRVSGYRIGGKTGTADKVNGNVIVSFVCFAPADDPEVIMLLTLDEPSKMTGTYVSGGNMVAPIASSVMAEILPYLGFEPNYTAEELVGVDATVPNVVGLSKDDAIAKLTSVGFGHRIVGSGATVTDQTPLGGAIVPNSAEIVLYCGATKSTELCTVPNVIGESASTANQRLTNAGLIMGVTGAKNSSSSSVRAITQSERAGAQVAAGTVVRVQFSDSSVTD